MLYIFWFLHQTTTVTLLLTFFECCISFDSYIKPQLTVFLHIWSLVVYLLIPTSNHNVLMRDIAHTPLYIFWFLHQTTTQDLLYLLRPRCISFDSYIKPQPVRGFLTSYTRCISFDSYIKPQPGLNALLGDVVVYLLIPTSNHNLNNGLPVKSTVVYLLIPTSNHNHQVDIVIVSDVVYLLIPTSNHNSANINMKI